MSKPFSWRLLGRAAGSALLIASSFGAGFAPVRAGEMKMPVRGFLCDTAEHAVQFADYRAAGESEEMSKDKVGRGAGAEVCGRYVGRAAIVSERVALNHGVAYRVTSFRFDGDQRIAWLAERSFAPTTSDWSL